MTVSEALPIALEFLGESLPPEFRWKPGRFSCIYHNLCPPDCNHPTKDTLQAPLLTDDLAMAMLRALVVREYYWEMDGAADASIVSIWSLQADELIAHENAHDPAEAIVLAVAALAQASRPSIS